MDGTVKAMWLSALRGGGYKQTKSRLKRFVYNDDGEEAAEFCCLGVLCDLYVEETGNARWIGNEFEYMASDKGTTYANEPAKVRPHYEGFILPEPVRAWAGLDNTDPTPINDKGQMLTPLATRNDNGQSFKQIARAIERYF